jgi:hypothetical protein
LLGNLSIQFGAFLDFLMAGSHAGLGCLASLVAAADGRVAFGPDIQMRVVLQTTQVCFRFGYD